MDFHLVDLDSISPGMYLSGVIISGLGTNSAVSNIGS